MRVDKVTKWQINKLSSETYFSEFSITGFHPSYSTDCEKIILCLLIKQKKFVFLSFSLLLKDILYWIPVSRLLGLLAFEDISKTVLIFLTVLHMVMSFFTFCDIKKLFKKILLKIKILFFPRDRMYTVQYTRYWLTPVILATERLCLLGDLRLTGHIPLVRRVD